MDKKEIMEIADVVRTRMRLRTCFNDQDRYAYEILSGEIGKMMSSEARAVLDFAKHLIKESFKYRKEFLRKDQTCC